MKGCPKCGRQYSQGEEFCADDGVTLVDLETAEKDSLVGTTLDGRYNIQKKLGEGGMGLVYLAIHAVIGKRCAVKVLRPDVNAESDMGERFIQEARSAAAIDNPHVIEITDFGQTPDGSAYFVMEFLDGRSLQNALKEDGRFDIQRAFHVAEQCCEALDAAHAAGVVHRDLKPENLILVNRDKDSDYVKVLDFGIAKVVRETGRLTRTGTIFGTPQYMAPEQAAGTAMDLRVDIYSLGIILYEMLCGRVPFEADTFMGVLTKHLYEQPVPPSQVLQEGLPRSVESIILKALSKKPERRYQTMAEFQEDLRAVIEGRMPEAESEEIALSTMPPPPSEVVGAPSQRRARRPAEHAPTKDRRPIFLGLGLVLAAAALGLGWFMTRSEGDDDRGSAQVSQNVVSPADAPPAVPKQNPEITLHSKPEGARIYLKNALMGKTPSPVPRPETAGDAVSYRLSLEGYQDLEVLISAATPESFTPELMPIPAAKDTEPATKEKVEETHRREKSTKSRKSEQRKKKKKDGRLGGDIVDPWGNK